MDLATLLGNVKECFRSVLVHEAVKVVLYAAAIVGAIQVEKRVHLLSRLGIRRDEKRTQRGVKEGYRKFERQEITEEELNELSAKYSLMKHIKGNETGIKEFRQLIPRTRLGDELVQELIDLARKHHPRSDSFAQLMKVICDEIATRRTRRCS